MRRVVVAALLLAASALPVSAAGTAGTNETSCGDKTSTAEIVDCLAAETKVWDQRLNAAYAALLKSTEPERRDPLRTAQRAWLQFRDANCAFYDSGEGTIHRIFAADCVRRMTQERALELQHADAS